MGGFENREIMLLSGHSVGRAGKKIIAWLLKISEQQTHFWLTATQLSGEQDNISYANNRSFSKQSFFGLKIELVVIIWQFASDVDK